MRKTILSAAIAATALSPTTGFAADMIVPVAPAPVAPAPVPAPLFSGFTAGVAGGGAIGSEASRIIRAPLKVLSIQTFGVPMGAADDIDCISDDHDSTDFDSCDDEVLNRLFDRPPEVRQRTAEQLLAIPAAQSPLTQDQRDLLRRELAALRAGEPIPEGTFGFVTPAEIIGEDIVVEATHEDPLAGLAGSINIGYQERFGDFTLGADIVGGYAGIDSDFRYEPVGRSAEVIGAGQGVQELGFYGLGRLKAGYVFDRFNPYIAGGVAVGEIEVTSVNPNTFGEVDETEAQVGYTLGAGINFAATDNIILNADYSYMDFGSNDYKMAENFEIKDLETEAHVIQVGVSFAF